LTDVPNSENPNVTFFWTSGTDPLGLTKHDEFDLDNTVTNPATSPQSRINLAFSGHNWKVRTCNTQCCSSWATDTFTIACSSPGLPTLTDVPSSHNTSASFSWTSGADPFGRPVYDDFELDNNLTSHAASPQNRINLAFSSHTWKVRTCNNYCCGNFVSKTFAVTNSNPSAPNNTNFTVYNSTTSLTWDSGIDSDGDLVYDEFQY
jgi:hypothetical protein